MSKNHLHHKTCLVSVCAGRSRGRRERVWWAYEQNSTWGNRYSLKTGWARVTRAADSGKAFTYSSGGEGWRNPETVHAGTIHMKKVNGQIKVGEGNRARKSQNNLRNYVSIFLFNATRKQQKWNRNNRNSVELENLPWPTLPSKMLRKMNFI